MAWRRPLIISSSNVVLLSNAGTNWESAGSQRMISPKELNVADRWLDCPSSWRYFSLLLGNFGRSGIGWYLTVYRLRSADGYKISRRKLVFSPTA